MSAPTIAPPAELCDKDGTVLELLHAEQGFEQWQCPHCTRRIVFDRDQDTAVRAVAWRGHPWEWPADAL